MRLACSLLALAVSACAPASALPLHPSTFSAGGRSRVGSFDRASLSILDMVLSRNSQTHREPRVTMMWARRSFPDAVRLEIEVCGAMPLARTPGDTEVEG